MSNLVTIEEKIEKILAKEFALDRDYRSTKIPAERKLIFMHKSRLSYIAIKVFKQANKELDKITDILVYKQISTRKTAYFLSEQIEFGLQEEREVALRELKKLQMKVCLKQVFLK